MNDLWRSAHHRVPKALSLELIEGLKALADPQEQEGDRRRLKRTHSSPSAKGQGEVRPIGISVTRDERPKAKRGKLRKERSESEECPAIVIGHQEWDPRQNMKTVYY
jgi:hypothetical protein